MEIPTAYVTWREELDVGEVSFGIGGLNLVSVSALGAFQVGYSRTAQGRSLIGDEGAWQSSWVAIGSETAQGDPIILDAKSLTVLTAPHGEGVWVAEPIASSLVGFGAALDVVRKLSVGRENPVALETNPLSAVERQAALEAILHANPGIVRYFWEMLLEL